MLRTVGTQKNVLSDFSALYEGQASFSLICSFLFPLLVLPQGRVFRTAVEKEKKEQKKRKQGMEEPKTKKAKHRL
jgi:hypothetical protein